MLRLFIKMRQIFSTNWKSSKQPRKQRKYLHNLPLHLKQKQMGSCLDKELRKKYGIRTLEVKKGDEVLILRGKFKKKTGKIIKVNRVKNKVSIEGLNVTKKDGNKVPVLFHPSKIKIIKLNDEDKKRLKRSNKIKEKENAPKDN